MILSAVLVNLIKAPPGPVSSSSVQATKALIREVQSPRPALPSPAVPSIPPIPQPLSRPPVRPLTLEQEFNQYVVRPCMSGLLAKNDLSGEITIDEFIDLAKRTGHYDVVEQSRKDILREVGGSPFAVRRAAYELAKQACIAG